jgi:hypothetical protein
MLREKAENRKVAVLGRAELNTDRQIAKVEA